MKQKDSIELYGTTALDYWRTRQGAVLKRPEAPGNEKHSLNACPSTEGVLSFADDLGLELPLQVSVPEARLRRPSALMCAHVWRALPQMGLSQEIAPGVCVSPPAVAIAQAAKGMDYVDLLLLVLEFAGCYVLSLGEEAGMRATKKPLVSLEELGRVAWAMRASGIRGFVLLEAVLRIAAAGSKSPMESKLYVFLSIDRRRGGLGIPSLQLNPRVKLDEGASTLCGRSSIRPDILEPKGRTAIEYQSDQHLMDGREKDDRRADALEFMGIRTFQVNKVRAQSLRELCAVGHVFAQRAGLRRPHPSEASLQKRATLHKRLFLTKQWS